jgi:nucleotide-binding universal stress UspA family protein
MVFRRHPDKHPPLFAFNRILVPVIGDDAVDVPALNLSVMLLAGHKGTEATVLHVIEVPFERNLDEHDDAAVARADKILERAQGVLASHEIVVHHRTVQARAAGPAIVDDAYESAADVIVMGLRYKKRFGGQWDAGRTVPYVMRNTTAPVWCLRAETEELAHAP